MTPEEIKKIIGNDELRMENFLAETENRFDGIEDLDMDEAVGLAIDLDFVKFNDDIPLWESGPKRIWIESFPTADGKILFWEEFSNSETCETQGRADSGIEIMTPEAFRDYCEIRKAELIKNE